MCSLAIFLIRPLILGPHLRPSSWVALLSAIRSLDHLCRLLYNHFLTSCRQHSSFTGWVMVVRRTQLAGWLLRSHDCFVSVVSRQRARVVLSSFAGSYFPLQHLIHFITSFPILAICWSDFILILVYFIIVVPCLLASSSFIIRSSVCLKSIHHPSVKLVNLIHFMHVLDRSLSLITQVLDRSSSSIIQMFWVFFVFKQHLTSTNYVNSETDHLCVIIFVHLHLWWWFLSCLCSNCLFVIFHRDSVWLRLLAASITAGGVTAVLVNLCFL